MIEALPRIKGIIYRNMLWAYRSPFRLTDVAVWPLVMLFTLTLFLSAMGGDPKYMSLLILAVIGWRALFFVCFETTAVFIETHWDRALPNLLASPISTVEIALGGGLTGVLKTLAVVLLMSAVCYHIYGFTIEEPASFAIALVSLMVAGFSLGLVLFGFSCYFDKRNAFTLSFILPELLGLVSGPYYSVDEVFPGWMAAVLNTFPTTHAFNLIKSTYGLGQADYGMLMATSALWLAIAIAANRVLYDLGRRKGTLVKVG